MISVIYNNDVYLDPVVTSVTWSGDITQAARRLEVSLKNTVDGVKQALEIELGRELRLYSDGDELFRGIIFAHDINARGDMTITAYDEAIYLTKNMDTRKFTAMTASSIIRQLCTEFGVEIGEIADTSYVIPKLILRDKTLWDMMTIALTETRKQNGRRFWLTARAGALSLIERGEKRVDWILENGTNILDASYSQSIEDMRNQVRVIGGDEDKAPISVTVKDSALIDRFGTMQHLERMGSDAKQAEVAQLARQLLDQLSKITDEARVEALGNVEVTAGTAVYVIEEMTRIVGGFYVITDSHTWRNGVHRMSLTVSGDESLPRLDYDEPPAAKQKKKKGANKDEYAAALARLGSE
ncbi:XkdQ/YqbQ family protein [Paenibacillus naphthalenovorans]|uniref:XkdQ/YqbQ family protein n=1 Tax=Paenibacillus naphthalenovorans TaxID=162209 RepID=UPI003D282467